MEEKGFVDSRQEERPQGASGLPRRLYRATPYGKKVHDAFAMLREALALKPRGGAMTFESRVIAFCRALPLAIAPFSSIVAPALADLQFEERRGPAQPGRAIVSRCSGPSPAGCATMSRAAPAASSR